MKSNQFNSRVSGPVLLARAAVTLMLAGLAAGCDGLSSLPGEVSRPSPSKIGDVSSICATLDGFVDPDTTPDALTVTGYSFVLFNREKTLQTCSGGDQDLSTVRAIASASKSASASAIMTLVDEHKLNLDRPISLYLLRSGVKWPRDKIAITMRMLLSHTSGLPGLQDDSSPDCLNQEAATTLEACVQTIADTPLVSTPGQAFNYGAASYQVAGYVATVIAKQSWQDFFSSRISGPLGMSSFSYGDPATVTNPRIAGGAVSNVVDYAKLMNVFLVGGDGQVLSASAIKTMQTNQIDGKTVQYAPVDSSQFPGYTLGFFISSPALYPGSAGPEFSDPGLFGTIPWYDLGAGYGAVLLISKNTTTGLAMWNAVRPGIIQSLK